MKLLVEVNLHHDSSRSFIVTTLRWIEVEPYVTSVVLNDDLISRLSFRSLCALRNDVLDAISRAKVNKMTIFRSIFKREVTADELMFERGEEPPSEFKNFVQR